MSVCISQSSPEKQNQKDIYKETYFKELAHAVVGTSDSKTSTAQASRLETQGRVADVALSVNL